MWVLWQKARNCSCLVRWVFAGLVPLDLATLPATMHPRSWRLALHLGGSACIAAAAKSPVQGQKMWQRVTMVRELWDTICNNIIRCGNMVRIDPLWIIDHGPTLNETKNLSFLQFPGTFACPCLRSDVVCEEENGQEGVLIVWRSKDECCGGNIIDDDGCVLKHVNADCRPGAFLGCSGQDTVWPIEWHQKPRSSEYPPAVWEEES